MRIVIAGVGYIGEVLADRLSEQGMEVLGITRSVDSAKQLGQRKPYRVDASDLGDLDTLKSLRERTEFEADAIVHCASSGRGGAEAYQRVFVDGLRHLHRIWASKIVFVSSSSVYGQTDGSIVDETSPTIPSRETGQRLVQAERFVQDLGGWVLRSAGIYGPGRSYILKKFFEESAVIEGTEGRILNQIHQDDLVNAILFALNQDAGTTVNVVDSQPQTQLEVYRWLADRFDKALPPRGEPDHQRKRAWTNKSVSNQKLRKLGWQPIYPSFQDAVKSDDRLLSSILSQVESS